MVFMHKEACMRTLSLSRKERCLDQLSCYSHEICDMHALSRKGFPPDLKAQHARAHVVSDALCSSEHWSGTSLPARPYVGWSWSMLARPVAAHSTWGLGRPARPGRGAHGARRQPAAALALHTCVQAVVQRPCAQPLVQELLPQQALRAGHALGAARPAGGLLSRWRRVISPARRSCSGGMCSLLPAGQRAWADNEALEAGHIQQQL